MKVKKTNNKKRLVLLDTFAILHRAYHAMPDFSSAKGEPTGALYGLSSMLLAIIQDLKPDYIAACYDLPGGTYRHEAFEGYKAGRKEKDEELSVQIERARDVLEAFDIPIYQAAGFEADDVIGTIVEQVKTNKDIDVIIASGDMDTLQLIDGKKVQVYTLRKGIKDTVMYDAKITKERYGFGPEHIVDYKGLRGDPSDNIPGIAGIGEKTATELIAHFGSIESIYKKLKKSEKMFEEKGIKARVIKLLKEGEEEALFSKMLATIRPDTPIKYIVPEETWTDSFQINDVLTLFTELGFRALKARVKDLFGVEESFSSVQGSFNDLENEEISEEDLKETSIALWLLQSNITSPTRDDILEQTQARGFAKAKEKIFKELKEKKLENIFNTIEKPLISIVDTMNARGITIDINFLKKLSVEYHKKLKVLEKGIFKMAGEEFNLKSPKQLGELLFEKMKIQTTGRMKKTSTGQYSTRESELIKLRDDNPIIAKILEYREFQKLLSTYIDNMPAMVGDDGRLHATFISAGTTTGRMASREPNLQNIPIKTELGRAIRHAFVAEKGFTLVAFDYSQIELRIAAFLSQDKKMMNVFKEGQDIHTSVASEVFKVTPDEVTKEMRRRAKVINFGILYGMGVNALRVNLGTDRKEAQTFLNNYFETFTGLKAYLEKVKSETARLGYTETLFGRRRYFEGIDSHIPFIRAQAERMAINAPIQGTEADIVKLAMIRTDEYIKKYSLENDVHLLLQVHDENVYEIKKEKVKEVVPAIKKIMESLVPHKDTHGVPIITGTEMGDNWGDMKEI